MYHIYIWIQTLLQNLQVPLRACVSESEIVCIVFNNSTVKAMHFAASSTLIYMETVEVFAVA